jgi:hypothetical protein
MYIFPLYNKEHNNLKKLQQLIIDSTYTPTYEEKTIIVKNRVWSVEIEELINTRFQNTELKTVMSFDNEYANDNYNDYNNAVYIYKINYRNSNYIEIVDLKTNRVIEKIELEPK